MESSLRPLALLAMLLAAAGCTPRPSGLSAAAGCVSILDDPAAAQELMAATGRPDAALLAFPVFGCTPRAPGTLALVDTRRRRGL